VLVCARCGQKNPEGARFCNSCGAPFESTALAREQRKTVSVVFCDVTGSTELGESTDPEALRALLARYFERMKAIVEAHGGSVEKFIGDAVMAVFGVPVAHEDDALRACRAAVEMRGAWPKLGINGRIGVNTGEVVTGTAERLATGDAVNVAARLEQAAQPGEVLIGGATLALVRAAVDVDDERRLELKGKAEPVPAYPLLAVTGEVVRRVSAPMVGRERELQGLRDAFARAVADRSCQLFTILGSAGVGKSRLVVEFLAPLGGRVVRGRCLSYGEGITYWPVVEILKQLGTLPEGVPARPLLSLLGETDASVSADEIAWGFRKLLEQEAQTQPLVVVFDDLHWAEETLFDLVEHIADLSRDVPILLLCMARPDLLERRPSWGGGKWNAATVLLEPLDAAETDRLFAELGDVPQELHERIVRVAEGNPLFLEEMLAFVRDSGSTTVEVPPTIHALLAARLDQLDPAERSVLESGSVEGRTFHRGAVAALADGDGSVDQRLVALVRKELVRPDRPQLPGDDAYRFRHLLIRDAAYDALPKAVRADLHKRFADWLEEHGIGLIELDEVLGYHLEQTHRYLMELGKTDPRVAGRAGERLAAAGLRAMEREDLPAARSLLGRAVELLPDDRSLRRQLLVDLGYAQIDAGQIEQAREAFDEALEAARRARDDSTTARARVGQLMYESMRPASDRDILEEVRRQIPTLDAADDDWGLAEAWEFAGTLEAYLGRTRAAGDLWERARECAQTSGHHRIQQRVEATQVMQEAWGHMPADEGIRKCERLLAQAEGTALEPFLLGALALYRSLRGDFSAARQDVQRGRILLTEFGNHLMAGASGMVEAQIELAANDPVAAEAVARESYETLANFGEQAFRSTVGCYLAEALRQQGLDTEAERIAIEASAMTSVEDFITHARSLTTRALVLARRGEVEAAQRLAREAVSLTAESDSFAEHGHALTALADVLELAGRREEATALLHEALHRYERKEARAPAQRVRERLAAIQQTQA
jgi:class 3 adenylate cyclase/tetratricopeptide (TPR) repeat protein